MSEKTLNNMCKKVKCGKVERLSFARIEEPVEVPYLISVQKDTYKQFLEKGIGEIISEFSPIEDFSGKAELHFLDYYIDYNAIKYPISEYRRRALSYCAPIRVHARLLKKETGETIDQDVLLGDVPLMTPEGTFLISGVDRVIVSQIVRSPSVYYEAIDDKNTGKTTYKNTLIPTRGTWLEFEQTQLDTLRVIIDRSVKVSMGVLLKGFGLGSEKEIAKLFGNNPFVVDTLDKEIQKTEEEALIELSKKLKPSELPSADAIRTYINNLFFTRIKYDLGKVGRYKYDKKLSFSNRLVGLTLADDVNAGGKVITAGTKLTAKDAQDIEDALVNEVYVLLPNGKKHHMRGNNRVNIEKVFKCDAKELGITEKVHYPTLMELFKGKKSKEDKIQAIKQNIFTVQGRELTMDDILASISYLLDLMVGIGSLDVVDHLANRRISPVGELVSIALNSGMSKLATLARETMQGQDLSQATPSSIISARPVNKALLDFMKTSPLSQVMDQVNPLSELTQKRKVSAVGPRGVSKQRATEEVRDIHYTHYGRICAIETPEGQSIGLINSLASYAKVNEYGFIETPYRKVDKETGVVTNQVEYLMADAEEKCKIAQAIEPLDENGRFKNKTVICRYKDRFIEVPAGEIDYVDVSPKQFISAATSLIPFLESDDTARALLGSNQQRQAVPLLQTESPIIGTGFEHKVARDNGALVLSECDGVVKYVDANTIVFEDADMFTI